jgi:hypothetical protein
MLLIVLAADIPSYVGDLPADYFGVVFVNFLPSKFLVVDLALVLFGDAM